ncbi:MAG: hypothetical protein JO261_05280 [Alphaproteobacteria bacterium]|nr:hypothetical protein [Alphaproteobacteria bacterium]
MKASRAARASSHAVLALAACLGLSACSDVDNALFGSPDENTQASAAPGTLDANASQQAAAQPSQSGEASSPQPQTSQAEPQSSAQPVESGTLPETPAQSAPAYAASPAIAPVQVEAGSNTGTAVSTTISGLRAELMRLEDRIGANAQRLAGLHSQSAADATSYYEAKAHITARLQVGTTRGNPELVAEWNTAQAALDQLTVNINALNALGTSVANDSSSAHYMLDQISATFNVSGAVDEDHRQLSVLEDETNQTIVLIDRLLKSVSEDIQRQTAYAANERANLTTLAAAIKNGELYGAELGTPMMASQVSPMSQVATSGTPLVVIRFDRPNVDYQQILYAALSQALQTRPGAGFSVVAVSPTRGTVTAVQLAQTAAKRHAQEVMRSITEMGVPASRLAVASSTDPGATSSEVRVFVR